MLNTSSSLNGRRHDKVHQLADMNSLSNLEVLNISWIDDEGVIAPSSSHEFFVLSVWNPDSVVNGDIDLLDYL